MLTKPIKAVPNSQKAAGTGTGEGPVTQFDGFGTGPSANCEMGETEKIPNTGDGLLFCVARIEKLSAIVVPKIVHMLISVTLKSGLSQVNLSWPSALL